MRPYHSTEHQASASPQNGDITVQTQFTELPFAQSCRLLDFDRVELLPGAMPGSLVLVVSGIAHWADLRVSAEAMFCASPPAFWPIEVVGRLGGEAIPAMVDFCVTMALAGRCGTEGIEIIGATKSERRRISI